MKVIEIQEFDDLLQFHESIWIQYCWVGCRPVERRWVESLSGVSSSSGWTSDRCGRSTVLPPGSRFSCLPGIYLNHERHDVFWCHKWLNYRSAMLLNWPAANLFLTREKRYPGPASSISQPESVLPSLVNCTASGAGLLGPSVSWNRANNDPTPEKWKTFLS